MDKETKLVDKNVEQANGGVVTSVANGDFDRCPMCDNPTPVIDGYCTCTNCGHRWTAGSH